MIINIRGTSGSGKSTIIRQVMSLYKGRSKVKTDGRKQPIGYLFQEPKMLAVIGHYETDCGGCDTISGQDQIYDHVRYAAGIGATSPEESTTDVLFEGLLLSAEANRAIKLHQDGFPLVVINLETPLDLCVASVNERREANFKRRLESREAENSVLRERGKKELPLPEARGEVNPRNTILKHKAIQSTMKKLVENGVTVYTLNREEALLKIRELLGV